MNLNNQIFPKQFIKHGKFRLHSGGYTDTFYDVNEMLTNSRYKVMLQDYMVVSGCDTYVGIVTGGAILASYAINFAMIKDGQLKGKVKGNYCLVDDVCTTESSLKEAIKIIGRTPSDIFVVVDRRKKKTLKLTAMYTTK